jgi:hypothetical protein
VRAVDVEELVAPAARRAGLAASVAAAAAGAAR